MSVIGNGGRWEEWGYDSRNRCGDRSLTIIFVIVVVVVVSVGHFTYLGRIPVGPPRLY